MDDNKAKWAQGLDVATKGVFICYGVGYLVETLHDSLFGIYDLELVRTRALFTGSSFLLFSALILLVIRQGEQYPYISSLWRYMHRRLETEGSFPRPFLQLISLAAKLTVLVELAQLGLWMTLVAYFPIDRLQELPTAHDALGFFSSPQERHFLVLWGIQSTCALALLGGSKPLLRRMPRTAAAFAVVISIVYVVSTKLIGIVSLGLVIWMLTILLTGAAINKYLRDQNSISLSLMTLTSLLFSAFLYARVVYPKILPWFGGPPRATISISCSDCSVNGQDVKLIDETTDGYYVIPAGDRSKNAIFVPRSKINEIKFSSSPADLMR